MRLWRMICEGNSGWSAAALLLVFLSAPIPGRAVNCTMQSALLPSDRDALAAAGGRLATAVAQQDEAVLQAALLPAVASDWEGMRTVVEQTAPLLKGGQIQLRNLYLLDATSLTAPADTQFFCSNATGSLTVTITMRALPPGRYAVVLADAAGAPLGGQLGFILVWDAHGPATTSDAGWKLGGLTVRQGIFDGHDGIWYWQRARDLAKTEPKISSWSAWYMYELARQLLLPVDFLTSPNLDKLTSEQAQIKNSPQNAFPYTLTDGPRSWKIDSITVDTVLRQPDLGVAYETAGVTDQAAVRTEATAVLSALLKAQPGLRDNFHGLWAYSVKDGKRTPIIELPMAQIP